MPSTMMFIVLGRFEGFHNTKDENGKMLQDGVEQFKDDLQELLSLRDGGKND